MNLKKPQFDIPLFSLISVSIVYILIYNYYHYDPILGYDAEAHFAYVDYLSRYLPREIQLPTDVETREFFNPPMGYIFPAVVQVICRNTISSVNFLEDCRPIYGKSTQIFQSFLYIFTIYINLQTLKIFTKSKSILIPSYLLLISLFAVNYRTISMIRGEPYILFFMSIFILLILKNEERNFSINIFQIFLMGLVIGAIALSRQWGFFLFLPIIVLSYFRKKDRLQHFKFWFYSASIGFLFSGWFYINLYINYGTFTAFNIDRPKFSIFNQPLNFYFPNFDQIQYLFEKPIRPYLDNQFISILYSDLWGDYWGYFSFTSRFLDIGRDQLYIGDYFARINALSLITTSIILVFCILTYKKYRDNYLVQYLALAILFSFLGYLIFGISFPNSSGDTIKATYIIQLFHLIAFFASVYFHDLLKVKRKMYNLFFLTMLIIYFHNFQSFLSHFPIGFYSR